MDQQEVLARLARADALRPAVVVTRQALGDAKRSLGGAGREQKSRESLLGQASSRLAELQSGHGARLASYGQATVYEFWIEVPGYSGPIRGTTARVTQFGDVQHVSDVQGKTKGGLGGAVVGGALLGPVGAIVGANMGRKTTVKTTVREIDTRQFALDLAGPRFAWSITVGPQGAASMQKFRDTVNARGSSNDDVKALAHAQAERVEAYRADMHGAALACQSAESIVQEASLAYERTWNEYASARLPFLDEVRARWGRSSVALRIAVASLPVLLAVLLLSLVVSLTTSDSTGTAASTGAGGVVLLVMFAAAAFYLVRVRLVKTGGGASADQDSQPEAEEFFSRS